MKEREENTGRVNRPGISKDGSACRKKPIPSDESPRFDYPVEWWFVHGHFRGKGAERLHFMVSLFRQAIPKKEGEPREDAFYVIETVTKPSTNECKSKMVVHKSAMDLGASYNPKDTEDVDPTLIKTYLNEVQRFGPPRSIFVSEKKVELKGGPLSYEWEDYSFKQVSDGFKLTFKEPFSGETITMALAPLYPALDLKKIGETSYQNMAYTCYPRMGLKGDIGGDAIEGEAWLDHQFGVYQDVFLTSVSDKVLGWEWLSMNLKDGTDVLLMTIREMKSGDVKLKKLMVKESDKDPVVYEDVNAEAIDSWESNRTHVVYPLKWRVTVPGTEIDLRFEPFVNDQEISFLGPARAIWEGAGEVAGTIGGRDVAGFGRLELYGFGYVFDIKSYTEHFIKRFDQHIENFFPKEIDEARLHEYLGKPHWKNEPQAYKKGLIDPVWDLMSRQGKHWRPIFGVLFLDSLGCPSGPYESLLATMLELNHTGAIIIDDIEDDSLLRRGDKCIHLKYGNDVAINAGNALYFLPYVQIYNHPHLDENQKFEIYRIIISVWVRSHFGQATDIYWSKYLSEENLKLWLDDSLEEKILQMYSYKTASAVLAVADAVCVIARSGEEIKKAYMGLGRIFGTAFQVIDDINNFSESKEWRKTCGEDLSAGKLTYVIVRSIKVLGPEKRRRLIDILVSKEKRNNPEILREGVGLIRESGALEACRKETREMIEKEWQNFSKYVPPSDAKTMIRMLIMGLTKTIYES